jgi:putative transposase
MRRFKSPRHAQRFLSVFGVIASFFRPSRHLLKAVYYREIMRRRVAQWSEIISTQPDYHDLRNATSFSDCWNACR